MSKLITLLISFLIVKSSFILNSKNYAIEDILKVEKIQENDLIEIYERYSNKLNEFEKYFVQIFKLEKEINSSDYSYLNGINTNATIVYLLESCYNKIKENFTSDIFYIFIIDEFPSENNKINYMNKFRYIIFNEEGKRIDITKLFCDENTFYSRTYINYHKTTIELNKVLNWKKEKNIDLLNIKDEFFWNVCFEYKDEDGIEMPMNIRKQLYYQNYDFCNNTVVNNLYSGFEYDSKNDTLIIICAYGILMENEYNHLLFDLDIALKPMLVNSNYKVLSCYKIIFKFYGKYFYSNIGNLICFLLSLGYILFFILFIIYGTREFEIKLNHFYKDAGFDIDAMNAYYKNTNKVKIIFLDINKAKNKKNKKDNEEAKDKYLFEKIKINEIKVNDINNLKDKSINHNQHKNNLKNSTIYKTTQPNEEKEIKSSKQLKPFSEKNIENNNKYYIKRNNIKNKDKDSSLKYLCGIIEDDINELEMIEALLWDKRNFWKIYLSFLKQYQLFYFTFLRKDFNIQNIKYTLFMFQNTLIFLFDTMCYSDESMENYYKTKYIFNIRGILRRSIVNLICTSVILAILKCLSYSEKGSRGIRFSKGIKGSFIRYKSFIICLKVRLYIYFIFVFILHLGCYYFIKGFCAVYPRTQLNLIFDTFISIVLNNIYPFGICLIPTLLRHLSLKRKNKVIFCLSQLF